MVARKLAGRVELIFFVSLVSLYRVECGVYADRAHLVRWLKVVLISKNANKQECFVGFCYRS